MCCRNTPEENVKNACCSLAPYLLLNSSTFLITNQAVDAIKAIVHTVDMKHRKLKKNNVRNTDRTGQLKQDSQSRCSKCPPWAFTQMHRVGLENKKLCGNKTSTGC